MSSALVMIFSAIVTVEQIPGTCHDGANARPGIRQAQGVRASTVAPGIITDTNLHHHLTEDFPRYAVLLMIAMLPPRVRETMALVLDLASHHALFVASQLAEDGRPFERKTAYHWGPLSREQHDPSKWRLSGLT